MPVPEHLRAKIESGRVVIFVGSGASLSVKNKNGDLLFPDWKNLLIRIADFASKNGIAKGEALKVCIDKLDTTMLLDIVKQIKEELPNDVWRSFLRTTFSISRNNIDQASLSNYEMISRIPTPLTITTNYDNMYQYASNSDIKTWSHKNSVEVNDLFNGNLFEKAVWHIHGHIDEISSIILCSRDYYNLYSDESSEVSFKRSKKLLERISEQYSILFIGFSLDDKYVLELLKNSQENQGGASVTHYAICLESEVELKQNKLNELTLVPIKNYGSEYSKLLNELSSINNDDQALNKPVLSPAIKNNLPDAEYLDTGFIGNNKIQQSRNLKNQIINSREFIFTIQGEGGIGKSATARFIAELIMDDPASPISSICWISSKIEELTQKGISQIRGAISSFEEIRHNIIKFFNPNETLFTDDKLVDVIPENTLIILDNIETISEPNLDYFLDNLPSNCKLLITSRRSLNRGLTYTPEELTETDAINLAQSYLDYLQSANVGSIINEDKASFVKKIHLNPLAIKWFVVGLYRGMQPHRLYELHEKDVLEYCIKNIYDNLSILGKAILDVLRLSGERLSYSKVCYLTNSIYKDVEDTVLDELAKQSLINKYTDGRKYKIEIKARVQSYLNYYSPLSEERIADLTKREKRLQGKQDNFVTEFSNNPYAISSLSNVNDDNIVSSIILHEVFLGLKKTDVKKLLNKIKEAKANSPDYFECYRVEASVLELDKKKYLAKQAFDEGYCLGGENCPSYLFHFAKLLMKLGNEETYDYLIILQKALKIDPESHEVWLELSRALLFKGKHQEARNEIKKILDSEKLDSKILSQATHALLLSYKREMEIISHDCFIDLVIKQITDYFLLPRSIRASIHSRQKSEYFKEALTKLSGFKNLFRSKKELDEINLLEQTLQGLVYPHKLNQDVDIYTVKGFNKNGDVEIAKGKNNLVINLKDWADTFPSSLLNVGEAVVLGKSKKFKPYRPHGDQTEVFLGCFPAIVAYAECNKDLVFTHLIDGSMSKINRKLSAEVHFLPGEPILVTKFKSNEAVEIIRQKHQSYISIIEKDSASKTNTITTNLNSNLNTRLMGKVTRSFPNKGFAILISGEKEYFLPSSKLIKLSINELNIGDTVEFNPLPPRKKGELPAAVNVVRLAKVHNISRGKVNSKLKRQKSVKSSVSDSKLSKKSAFPMRKYGAVLNISSSIVRIDSSSGVYIYLRSEPRAKSLCKALDVGSKVWFSVESKYNEEIKKATSLSRVKSVQ